MLSVLKDPITQYKKLKVSIGNVPDTSGHPSLSTLNIEHEDSGDNVMAHCSRF